MLRRGVRARERDLKFIYRPWDLKIRGMRGRNLQHHSHQEKRRDARRDGVSWSWKNGEVVGRWTEDVRKASRRLLYVWEP